MILRGSVGQHRRARGGSPMRRSSDGPTMGGSTILGELASAFGAGTVLAIWTVAMDGLTPYLGHTVQATRLPGPPRAGNWTVWTVAGSIQSSRAEIISEVEH